MIPVSLTLQGIYSYQEKQTIDFTRLTSAGIFGIFGPVGSGKSTILEAITFALYGRTDRLNLSGDNRNYNMMNLKSNEMFIEFVFRAGAEQTGYMALVRSRRNSRQFEDVKACERTAYKKIGDEWIPLDINLLENIIGLSYDNFKRTVIIPQNRFQEFLFLKGAERSDMLKELFDLQRYELSSRVISLETRTLQQKQNIEGNLQQLGEVSPEKIVSTENELTQTISFIELKSSELVKIQEQEAGMRHIRDLSRKLSGYQGQLQNLKLQEQELLILEKRLKSFEYCLITFKEIINKHNTCCTNIGHLKQDITGEEARLEEISAALNKLQEEFESIRKEYDCREVLRQKADELSKIARIIDLQERYQQFQGRIKKGEQEILNTVQKIEELKSRTEKFLLELKGLKEELPDMNRLSKAREWFTVRNMLLTEGGKLKREKSVLTDQLHDLGRQISLLHDNEILSGVLKVDNQGDIAGQLESMRQAHLEGMNALNQEKQHYQVQQKLEEYASDLEEGKPCPLCGSLTHPQKYNSLNIRETLMKIESELKTHDEDLKGIDTVLKKFAELKTAIFLKEEILKGILLKEEENQTLVKAHQELFCWEEFEEEAGLSRAFENAEKVKTVLEQKEKELENVRILTEKENRQKEIYSKAIESLKSNSLQELTVANTLKEQLAILDLNAYTHRSPDELNSEMDALLQQYKAIELKYQQSADRMNLLRKDQDILSGKLESNRKMLGKEHDNLEALTSEIDRQLKASAYSSLEEVKNVLAWNPDLEKERSRISSYRQELDFVEKQLQLIQLELKDQSFDEEVYKTLLENIQSFQTEINRKNEEKGSLQAILVKMKADLEKRILFQDAMLKTEQRLDDIKVLKQLFKGSGFVKYISSVYLQELVHAANERFYRLSGQKLRLEITPENDFEIRDFMNGGKTRNVKTLSGGQTFQAALSLALALSDNTRKNGAGENFFFLDEGFGSLDKDSLQVVFDTLKALRHENRIVGLISHVEDMNQEVDIHLRVKSDEERGSIIERSWEG